MNLLFGICLGLGILSLIYYGLIIIYAGIGSTFSWFWLIVGIVCILLCIGIRFITKYEIKITYFWRFLIIASVTVGLSIFLLIEGTLIYYAKQKAEPGRDYLIVLGAQIKGTKITKSLKKRLDTAEIYLKENPLTIAIVSGGQGPGEDSSESEAMKQYLMVKGIDEIRIIKEDKSTNTNENIRFSKGYITKENASVAIVTNGFHIFRSVSIAKKQGLNQVQGLPAPSDYLLVLNYYVREAAGVLKDKLFGNL